MSAGMVVRFQATEEFLAELADEVSEGGPVGRLVRTTYQRRLISGGAVKALSVVATFRSIREEVVALECFAGDLWDHERDLGVQEKAAEIRARILSRAEELGLDTRAGVLAPAGQPERSDP